MHRLLELDLVRVVEDAAIASAHHMGTGDRHIADEVATQAMRNRLNQLNINGRIVIGEGERDEAPMLYIGEKVGTGKARAPQVDIAVDPLEGTNLCATGSNNAITVMAMSERGGLLHAPDIYMKKLIVCPEAAGKVDIDAPVKHNLRVLATALKRTVSELVVVVLERNRHEELIAEIRSAGARIRLITDGDIMPSIAATVHGPNIHAVIGIGAAPEGVITAAALKCLKGYMQGQFVLRDETDRKRLIKAGVTNVKKVFEIDDLAPGKSILFAATGVTNGDLLKGVRFFAGAARTNTMVMSLREGTVRFIDSIHSFDRKRIPVLFV